MGVSKMRPVALTLAVTVVGGCHLIAGLDERPEFGPSDAVTSAGGTGGIGGAGGAGGAVGGGGDGVGAGGAGGEGGTPDPCADCGEEEICKFDRCDAVVAWAIDNGEGSTSGIQSVAATFGGGVVVGGSFEGSLDFPVSIGDLNAGDAAGFMVEYNANGVPLIAIDFEAADGGTVLDGEVDATEGAFLFGGRFSMSLTLDSAEYTTDNIADFDGFVAHLDATGDVNWAKQFTGDNGQQLIEDVAFDDAGNVYVVGRSEGSCDVEGDDVVGPCTFVASYNGNGTLRWSTVIETGSANNASLAVGDGVYVASSFNGSAVDVGGATELSGTTDHFLVKYQLDGSSQEPIFVWAKSFETNSTFQVADMAADETGVVLTGSLLGTLTSTTLGRGAADFTAVADDSQADVFIASFAADGQVRHQGAYGDNALQFALGIALGEEGEVVATGYYSGAIDFGGEVLNSDADEDMYFAVFDEDGAHLWSHSLPAGGGHIKPNDVAAAGTVSFVGGGYTGSFDQPPDVLMAEDSSLFLTRIDL